MFLRNSVISQLIETHGYRRYLEIGVERGQVFRSVRCPVKHGVDPASPHATFRISSDEFFDMLRAEVRYDLIFVDGLHVDEQAQRDIENSLEHLSDDGMIVVHDCNPPTEWHQRSYEEARRTGFYAWNGTVWKAFVRLRATRSDLEMCVVNADWGCGLIRPGNQLPIELDAPLTYQEFARNRSTWLGLIDVDQFQERFATAVSNQ